METIASSHPEWPGEITDREYAACREFISQFDTIYTLNYDLLLYWTLMHTEEGEAPASDDGFLEHLRTILMPGVCDVGARQ